MLKRDMQGGLMRRLLWICALTLAAFTSALPAAAQPVAGTPLFKHEVRDRLGRMVTYYASRPKQPSPVLLMVQGSGCSPVLVQQAGQTSSTIFGLMPFAADERFTVVAVEKPFADPAPRDGTAEKCSLAFNRDFTAERWLVALRAALDDVLKQPFADERRIAVFGASEGAVMASLLAGRDRRITDAVVINGSGTTQLFDFIALAYDQCFDRTRCISDIEQQVAEIRRYPLAADRFAWGHPYQRWTSFFGVDPGAELVNSGARIYWALGTADQSVPALSQEIALAKLMVAGKDVTVRRVPGADHSLMPPGRPDYAALDRELRTALQWILDARR